MATKQKGVPLALRAQLKLREHHTCQKCGARDGEMHGHHIKPARDGGPDELDNLALLCASCHFEWEGLEQASKITFAQWLTLPTAHFLLGALLTDDAWQEDMSAKDAREGLLAAWTVYKTIHANEPHPFDLDYEDETGESPEDVRMSGANRKILRALRNAQMREQGLKPPRLSRIPKHSGSR